MSEVEKLLDDVITEDKTLEEQLAIINRRMAAAKTPQAEVMMITPGVADFFTTDVQRHLKNRRLRNTKIKRFAESMREPGGWQMTGQPIVFELGPQHGGAGRLTDGYHRFRGCVRAKRPFVTLVVFGIEASAFRLIDTGTSRTAIDAYRIADVENPEVVSMAVRWIKIYSGRNRYDRGMKWENIDSLAYYETLDQAVLLDLVPEARRIAKASNRLLPKSQVLGFLYMMQKRHPTKLAKFIDLLSEPHGNGAQLMDWLAKRQAGGMRIHENLRTVALETTRDAIIRGERLTQRNLTMALANYLDTQADARAKRQRQE